MGLDSGMHSLGLTLQVFFLDLLLSGDNAIVIALACRRLPAQQMRQAILVGTGAAIGLRILFTTMVTFLLAIPLLKLLGMMALIAIAIKLLIEEDSHVEGSPSASENGEWGRAGSPTSAQVSLGATIGVIVVADVTMSLDNVVALAAISQNSVFFLVLGLALSVPLLMYGSLFVTTLLKRYPILIPAGGALLGWIAGDIGMSDPLIADWVTTQLPGLTLAVPLACAIFVLLESKIIQENMRRFPRLRPIFPEAGRELPLVTAASHSPTTQFAPLLNPAPHRPPERQSIRTAPADEAKAMEEAGAAINVNDHLLVPGKRHGTFAFLFTRQGSLYFLILLLALPVLGVIGSIVYNGLINKGLMPAPSSLMRYECPGYTGPFSFYFRHGKDNVQIRSSSGRLDGVIHYGKIDWINFSGDTAVLGFTPPHEITYDDAKSIRINGGSFLQINCANKPISGS